MSQGVKTRISGLTKVHGARSDFVKWTDGCKENARVNIEVTSPALTSFTSDLLTAMNQHQRKEGRIESDFSFKHGVFLHDHKICFLNTEMLMEVYT